MSKKTRAQYRDIVSHVLSVLQLEDTTIKAILEVAKIDTIIKLRDTAMEILQDLSKKGVIAAGDISAIQSVKSGLKAGPYQQIWRIGKHPSRKVAYCNLVRNQKAGLS
jgi:hypothetical protein